MALPGSRDVDARQSTFNHVDGHQFNILIAEQLKDAGPEKLELLASQLVERSTLAHILHRPKVLVVYSDCPSPTTQSRHRKLEQFISQQKSYALQKSLMDKSPQGTLYHTSRRLSHQRRGRRPGELTQLARWHLHIYISDTTHVQRSDLCQHRLERFH
jgi:hypothetical protein